MNNCFIFCAFFLSFISNRSIRSIDFRANLDAQNAGNGISGLQISKMFWVSILSDPPIHARYVGHTRGLRPLLSPLIYYLTERSLFKKFPPTGKSLKKVVQLLKKVTLTFNSACVTCNDVTYSDVTQLPYEWRKKLWVDKYHIINRSVG